MSIMQKRVEPHDQTNGVALPSTIQVLDVVRINENWNTSTLLGVGTGAMPPAHLIVAAEPLI